MPDRRDLDAAYRATNYVAVTPRGKLTLRVDEGCIELDEHLVARGVEAWAYITAWNPGSNPVARAENDARQDELRAAATAGGFAYFEGAGVGAGWDPEPSLLILGIDETAAAALGRRFRQAAIVVGARGMPARLLWLTADGADGDPAERL